MVRPYRTFSVYIVKGETRSAGCLCTSSGWLKHIEPRRTFPNHIITEIAKCVEFCHMSSGWFDHTEPSLSTSLKGKQGVQGAYALVRGGSSTSNHVEPSRTTSLHSIGWNYPELEHEHPPIPCLPCDDVDKEGSVQSNHKTSTHIVSPRTTSLQR